MEATQLSFGEWLRRRRKALDLTQAELAAQVPCAKGTVRRFESDDLRPSKLLAERLAEVLTIPAQLRSEFVLFARSGAFSEQFAALLNPAATPTAPPTVEMPLPAAPRRYTVPAAAHPLVGRQHAARAAIELLTHPDVRLVTLIGPPGVGKTRLALHVAGQLQQRLREGACFVALAPLRDAERVLSAIAQAIDLADSGRILATALADRLRGEELLLVLDNFEHVIEAASQIATLLAAAPTIRILCTSRVPLRIVGEHEFVVPPLALPELAQVPSPTALEQNPSVALFTARARGVHAGFTVTDDNVRQIAEICNRLDGLPLAIELAANRVKLFPPAALLARLDRRLPFLTGGTRDAPARQRTLEAAIGWSYDLLSAIEKRCLARLSVFPGGATLEAAEVVCGPELDLIEALTALVDHSLVQSNHLDNGDARFSMLETIREFALARLRDQGETDVVQARHARYFLTLAEAGERGLQGADQVRWMRRLNAENNNLRAAFAWSLSDAGDVALGLSAGAALWWFWWTNGQVGEGRAWLTDLIRCAATGNLTGTPVYGRALLGAGILAFFAGDVAAARSLCTQARDLAAQLQDTITHGYAVFMIGTIMVLSEQQADGYAVLAEGLRILRSTGDTGAWYVGVTSLASVLLTLERDDLDEAQRHADTAMAIFRRFGQPYGIGLAFNYQGDVARRRGDYSTAAERYRSALPLLRAANARSEIPAVLHNLAHILLDQGDTLGARSLFAEGLELHREIGNRMGMAECLIGLAMVLLALEQPLPAIQLLGMTDALLEALNLPLFLAEQAAYRRVADATRTALEPHEWEAARQTGRMMLPSEVIKFVDTALASEMP